MFGVWGLGFEFWVVGCGVLVGRLVLLDLGIGLRVDPAHSRSPFVELPPPAAAPSPVLDGKDPAAPKVGPFISSASSSLRSFFA